MTRDEASRLRGEGDGDATDLIQEMLGRGLRTEGEPYGLLLLSAADDPDTVDLGHVVENDTQTASGKPWTWTLGQRYTRLDRLRSARTTSEL